MERAGRPGSPTGADAPAGERYLLLADISGYAGFMAGVEQDHGVDFGAGIPAAYSVLGALPAAPALVTGGGRSRGPRRVGPAV